MPIKVKKEAVIRHNSARKNRGESLLQDASRNRHKAYTSEDNGLGFTHAISEHIGTTDNFEPVINQNELATPINKPGQAPPGDILSTSDRGFLQHY